MCTFSENMNKSHMSFSIRFGSTWFYYGAVLLTTTILEMGHNPHCGIQIIMLIKLMKNLGHHEHETIETGCQMSNSFYLKLVWTSVAEFPGKHDDCM